MEAMEILASSDLGKEGNHDRLVSLSKDLGILPEVCFLPFCGFCDLIIHDSLLKSDAF
ncbi:hypothetical protein SLEP1_g60401 [Rubroshorea leprosula]|uniref:Uncharacterized protein n=1 Tax=Rubroshorea leprosula TaxID=152421 RepID=A0AAV5MYH0_9ROSI|nr:hypothetical protein SLEP1_g60401 [Rubroshorea leprosula]